MAYSKQTWDTTSYVNPTRMNHIEQGIYDIDARNKTFTYAEKSPDSATTLTAGQSKTITFSVANGTWIPFCLASWSTGNIDVTVANIQFQSGNIIRFDVKNIGSSSVSITPVARIQYISS